MRTDMTDELIPIDQARFAGGNILRSLLINALINTLIAVILFAIGFGSGFVVNLVFSQCIGMSIFSANLAVLPLFRRAKRLFHQVLIILAVVVLGASAGTLLGAVANGIEPFRFVREHSGFFTQVVFIGLLCGSLVSYIFISLGKLSDEKMKRLEVEKNALETELKLLQSQIEPHFLFNTLSNVISLIDSDPEKARAMLESFAAFLRATFLSTRGRTVPLSRELDLVRNYLSVFAVRMGVRLQYRIDLPDELRAFPVPPLLIQPLVENAVKHGLEPSREGGELSIRVAREGMSVRISVSDTGEGMNEQGPGAGIGLENIRKRLRLAYGGEGRLSLEENSPKGTRVVMELPYETNTGHHS